MLVILTLFHLEILLLILELHNADFSAATPRISRRAEAFAVDSAVWKERILLGIYY